MNPRHGHRRRRRVSIPLAHSVFLLANAMTAGAFMVSKPSSLNKRNLEYRSKLWSATLEPSVLTEIETDNKSDLKPTWDPEKQVYVGGVLPENAEVARLIERSQGYLRVFGYGSLCWHTGDGVLSKKEVVGRLGRALGYKRCWSQRSTDHRGRPNFPGIVCTLLTDGEVRDIRRNAFARASPSLVSDDEQYFPEEETVPTMTEGVVYLIPPELVDECLAELDYREKGGYARDVIDVVEDETGTIHRALLYRGTPDNPAFWSRPLLDLPFAAGKFESCLSRSRMWDSCLEKR